MNKEQTKKMLDSMLDLQNFVLHSCRNPKRLHLSDSTRGLIEMGAGIFGMEGWEEQLKQVEVEASNVSKEHERKGKESWK